MSNSGQFSYPLPNMVHPLVEGSVRTGAGNCPEFGVVCGPELVTVRNLSPEFAPADEPCSVADTKTVRSLCYS